MKFKTLYSINEKFTGKFMPRDFGDGKINIVSIPDDIGDYSMIETYVHNKDSIWSFVFDDNNDLIAFITGDANNPANGHVLMKDKLEGYNYMRQHPSDPTAMSQYSGVEPIKPPFKNYNGTYHIPKEFNMKKFAPIMPTGIRTDEDWDLN